MIQGATWRRQDRRYPSTVSQRLKGRAPKAIAAIGDAALLERKLLGILASRTLASGALIKVRDLLCHLLIDGGECVADRIAFVGGWDSPFEEECMRYLLADGCCIVRCLARDVRSTRRTREMDRDIEEHRLLLLSREARKRQNRESMVRRNRLVWALSDALWILDAPTGSGTAAMAREALEAGVPVLVFDTPPHRGLIDAEAIPATSANILRALEVD